jgi:signal transduction histidine kinase
MVWNFILYLLYGLAFFTLGVAILSRDTRLSELGIARIIWLLAIFGILHGFHEWLELLEQLNPDIVFPAFSHFRLILVGASFLFLLYFGLFLNIITVYGDKALKTTPVIAKISIALAALVLIVMAVYFDYDSGNDITIRRMVGFPGALLSGIGLVMYSRTIRAFSVKVAGNFILAGAMMVCYSIFTGIVPSDVIIPLIEIRIIMLRGLSAFLIMFFTIKALSVFSLEQRKLIDEKLQRFAQSEKHTSMGILAAGIAHEINNPLTNVTLNLEMLRDMVGGREQINRKLDSIERNISRASSIAQELLHFAREKETSFERVNLNEVIRSSVNLIKSHKLGSIIRLNLHDIPDVMGVPYRLEEVFINVLMNSLDACSEGDTIEVQTFFSSGNVIAEVSDTGHGISSNKVSQVFDPFYTTKEIGKGTGLGLSVCYNIIKQHKGDISMLSSEQGGAIVTILIPAVIDDA